MRRLLLATLTALLFICLGSCGGDKQISSFSAPQTEGVTAQPADTEGSISIQRQGFRLNVFQESFNFGGRAEFTLDIDESADGPTVTVLADAVNLRSVLLALYYDADSIHPVDCNEGTWPSLDADQLLQLTVLDEPGAVHHGAVIPRPQEADGVAGEIEVLTVNFAAGAAPERVASAVPDQAASATPDLTVDIDTGAVGFSYVNLGDYNQNSIVEVGDITPLGVHFAEQSPDFPDPFPWESIGSVVDGNQNGLIEVADLTPLGQNFGNTVDHWLLYGGDIADYPENAGDDNGAATELATIEFPAGGVQAARLMVDDTVVPAVGMLPDYEALWLRPVGDAQDEGVGSNRVDVPQGDRDPPVWTIDPEGVGAVEAIPLDGGVRLMWGEATDAESPPVTYIVYYNEGAAVDFETASTLEVPVSDPPDDNADRMREITGLTNGMEYALAVRARDDAETPNEDENTNTLTATPLVTAEVPTTITEGMTFDGPMVISNGNTVTVTGGECLHFMSDLTIEDGATFQGLNDDFCIIVHGNLICNGTILYSGPEEFPSEQDANSLQLVLKGGADFGDTSVVTGNGNIYIVDDEVELIPPEDVETETDNDTNPEEYAQNWMPEDTGESGGGKGATMVHKTTSRTVYYGPRPGQRWIIHGDWGSIPPQPKNVTRVVLRAHQANGEMHFQNFNIEGPPGKPGADKTGGCSVVGGDGEDNRFRLRMHASRQMTFTSSTIKLGDGGRGGNATTDANCCPTAYAKGGKGGKPSNRFRFTAGVGGNIDMSGTFNFNPGNGGKGGEATAMAGPGKDGCPPEKGCDATAIGGEGGEVPRWGAQVRGNVTGLGNMTMGQAEGGQGGAGIAVAGPGGSDTCECEDGGTGGAEGGTADATGGNGGDAQSGSVPGGAGGGGCKSGDGGEAEAYGGDGGGGLSCEKEPGSDGGKGGDATATSGDPGTASGTSGSIEQGEQSAASAYGGDGGDGGDGWGPGAGGKGGTATAEGNPATEEDGEDGEDGEIQILFFSDHTIGIPELPDDFEPGPIDTIPAGIYPLPLYDAKNGNELIGEIGLILSWGPGEPPGVFQRIDYGELLGDPTLPVVLRMTGNCTLSIARDQTEYFDPADANPWVGVDITHFYTEYFDDTVDGQFWHEGVKLNHFTLPENLVEMAQEDRFYVLLPPEDSYGGFWDQCDIHTYESPTEGLPSVTELIEVGIIDP